MADETKQPAASLTLYKGVNEITLNYATILAIVSEWLSRNHGGVKLKADTISEQSDGVQASSYKVKFIQEPIQ